MRKIVLGLGSALVAILIIVYLRSASHQGANVGLQRLLADLPPGMTATHGAASYDPILGNFSVADLTLLRNGAPVFSAAHLQASGVVQGAGNDVPQRVAHLSMQDVAVLPSFHAARMELTGLALADLRDVTDPDRYPGGKPAWTDKRMLLEQFDAADLSLEQPMPGGKTVSLLRIAHATLENLAGRPADVPPTPENLRTPAFWAALLRVTSEKSAVATKIDLVQPGKPHVTIGSDTTEDVDQGRIGSVRLQDMRVDGGTSDNPVLAKLADLSVSGVDVTSALAKLIAARNDPKQAGNFMLGPQFSTKMHASGGDITLGKGPHIQLASMDTAQDRKPDGTKTGEFTMRDFSVAYDHAIIPPAQEAALKRFGMSVFVFDVDAASTANVNAQHGTLTRFDVAARGLGTLHLTGQASGPIFDGQSRSQPEAWPVLQQTRLENATLRWEDASLTNRIFDAVAENRGTTPEALRTQVGLMTIGLAMILPNQPDAGAQVSAFINNPKTLTISLAPPKPVTIGEVLAAPMAARASLLGVHIQGE
jgi:hypothetical protein